MYTDARFKASPKPPAAWRELRTNSDSEGLRTTVAWNSRSLTNHARGFAHPFICSVKLHQAAGKGKGWPNAPAEQRSSTTAG